jgi:hypothetical protein
MACLDVWEIFSESSFARMCMPFASIQLVLVCIGAIEKIALAQVLSVKIDAWNLQPCAPAWQLAGSGFLAFITDRLGLTHSLISGMGRRRYSTKQFHQSTPFCLFNNTPFIRALFDD